MMKYAAIFITFIALLFSPRLNESTNITRADFSQLNRVELPEITVSPVIETTIQEIQPQEPAKESTEDTLLQDKNNYKVIVAAFDLPEKAMLLRDKLKKEDYPESEIIVTSNNTRVAIRSFSNIISAVNYMEEVRNEDPRFADAWVMKSE